MTNQSHNSNPTPHNGVNGENKSMEFKIKEIAGSAKIVLTRITGKFDRDNTLTRPALPVLSKTLGHLPHSWLDWLSLA